MVDKPEIIPGKEEFQKEFNLSDLNVDNEIRRGNFGTDYAIQGKKNGKMYAVIQMPSDESVKNEKEILLRFLETNFLHNNIVQISGIFQWKNKKGNQIFNYIVMEKGDRSLQEDIEIRRKLKKPFSEQELFELFQRITVALQFLHQKCKIFHKNLKPSNIILFNASSEEVED